MSQVYLLLSIRGDIFQITVLIMITSLIPGNLFIKQIKGIKEVSWNVSDSLKIFLLCFACFAFQVIVGFSFSIEVAGASDLN